MSTFDPNETIRKGTDYGLPYDTVVIPLSNGGEITIIPFRDTTLYEVVYWDENDYGRSAKICTTQQVIDFIQQTIESL